MLKMITRELEALRLEDDEKSQTCPECGGQLEYGECPDCGHVEGEGEGDDDPTAADGDDDIE